MPKIIQIKGTQCSGKTWSYQDIKDEPNVVIFDILDFYKEHGCINSDNLMDWKRWEEVSPLIPAKIKMIFNHPSNKDKVIIIEHSNNGKINNLLSNYEVHTLELLIPSKDVLIERAIKRELDPENVIAFAAAFERNYGSYKYSITPEAAKQTINSIVRGEKMSINYISGSALEPVGSGQKIICHVCNDIGGWGSGFVVAISNKWNEPEESYRQWAKDKNKFELGFCKLVRVEEDIQVANMIAQHETIRTNETPIKYDALKTCLIKIAAKAKLFNATVHMPRIGTGLAGGKWEEVEKVINETLIEENIDTYVYTLPGDKSWR